MFILAKSFLFLDYHFSFVVDLAKFITDIRISLEEYDNQTNYSSNTIFQKLYDKFDIENKKPKWGLLETNQDKILQIMQKGFEDRWEIITRYFKEFYVKDPFLASYLILILFCFVLFCRRLFFYIVAMEILIIATELI